VGWFFGCKIPLRAKSAIVKTGQSEMNFDIPGT